MAAVNFEDEEAGAAKPSFEKFEQFYKGYSTLELIRAMQKVREQKDALEEELSGATAEHDYLSKVAIPNKFEAEGIKNMNVEGIGLIKLTADIYASIKKGAKDQLFGWLRDAGFGDLITPAIPPSTLKAFLKGRIKAGEEYPEELVNVTPFSRASITKK